MKKTLLSLLLVVGTLYPTTMIVTETNQSSDIVTMFTATGFLYELQGIEDNCKGDLISCIMDSKGTENITDDTIVSHRYVGTLDMFNIN